MKSKIGIMAILGLFIIIVLASGCTDQKSNNTTQVNTSNTTNSTVKATDVTAKMTGPSEAKKGSTVALSCSVSNKGSQPVKNVKIHSQESSDNNLGTIAAGETKSFTINVYIPTDAEVQQDFGVNATVSNPFYVGGFAVTFTDSNGAKHTINSNHLNIPLT